VGYAYIYTLFNAKGRFWWGNDILGYIVSLGFVKDIQWVSGQYKNPGDSFLVIYIYN
jgi:hypothetical protein